MATTTQLAATEGKKRGLHNLLIQLSAINPEKHLWCFSPVEVWGVFLTVAAGTSHLTAEYI